LKKAYEAARAIEVDRDRFDALLIVAPYFEESQRSEVLKEATEAVMAYTPDDFDYWLMALPSFAMDLAEFPAGAPHRLSSPEANAGCGGFR